MPSSQVAIKQTKQDMQEQMEMMQAQMARMMKEFNGACDDDSDDDVANSGRVNGRDSNMRNARNGKKKEGVDDTNEKKTSKKDHEDAEKRCIETVKKHADLIEPDTLVTIFLQYHPTKNSTAHAKAEITKMKKALDRAKDPSETDNDEVRFVPNAPPAHFLLSDMVDLCNSCNIKFSPKDISLLNSKAAVNRVIIEICERGFEKMSSRDIDTMIELLDKEWKRLGGKK